MINNDSIVTAYDEHLTLVEWLQKTEKALNESVLTNLGIAKLSEQGNVATYQVTATFADNTTIVSNTFTLPSTNIVTAFNDLTALVNGFDDRITDNTNNIAKALFTPSSAPSTRKVVTIDTNGAQENVDSTSLTTLMGNIVDSDGNKRFVEGNLTLGAPFANLGVTMTYGKWQLSGGHLMIVVALKIPSGVTTPTNSAIARVSLPAYIRDKLVGLWGTTLDIKNFAVRNSEYWYRNILSLNNVNIFKADDNTIFIASSESITTEVESTCRIQFDFIID